MRLKRSVMPFVLSLSICLCCIQGCAQDTATNLPEAKPQATEPAKIKPKMLRSVEELPVDRFDEYQAGTFPPEPWIPLGPEDPAVTTTLKAEAESPFVGNAVTGKALVVNDQSQNSGTGTGIGCEFFAPPEGKIYIGFDFRYSSASGKANELDTVMLLDTNSQPVADAPAPALELHLGQNGKLSLWGKDNTLQPLAELKPDLYYHIALVIDGGNVESTVTAADNISSNQHAIKVINDAFVENASGSFLAPKQFTRLSFFSNGPDTAIGSWTIDNICMAGQVDASRKQWFPFEQLPKEALRTSEKKVFAYYYIYTSGLSSNDPGLSWFTRTMMNPTLTKKDRQKAGTESLCRPLPRVPFADEGLDKRQEIEKGMEEEVRLAIQQGLDGFFADFHTYPVAQGGQAHFTENSFSLMNAAHNVDPDFKIIPAVYSSAQNSGINGEGDEGCDPIRYANSPIIKRIAEHPATMRLPDGRIVFSMWLTERHSANWWQQVMQQLEKNGTPIALVAQFNSYNTLNSFNGVCYGMAHWGPRDPRKFDWTERVRPLTEKVVFPICNQDVRTRGCELWEAEGSGLLRSLWSQAIGDGADWAFMNTWSDYTETPMEPSTYMGFVPYDISAYYIQWFKTGRQPEIVRDRLYYFYRRNRTDTQPEKGTMWSFRQGQPQNEVELLAFLKEPGVLSITIDGNETRKNAPAGITSFKMPMPEGKQYAPSFALYRDDKTVAARKGHYTVLDPVEYQHMIYSSGTIPTNEELSPEP